MVDELVKLVVPRFILLVARGTKTIKLRSGQISLRLSSPALEVADSEEAVLQRIAKAGGVRRFTRPGKRTLNKDALKKNPSFVKRIKGLLIVQHQNLVIKPSKIQGEIVRDAEGLQDPFGNEED